jgi:hypothetical protein
VPLVDAALAFHICEWVYDARFEYGHIWGSVPKHHHTVLWFIDMSNLLKQTIYVYSQVAVYPLSVYRICGSDVSANLSSTC